MLSTVNPSEILEIVLVTVGVILVLKRVAEMDRYHRLRVVVLTLILSSVPAVFFLSCAIEFGRSGLSNCVMEFSEHPDHY